MMSDTSLICKNSDLHSFTKRPVTVHEIAAPQVKQNCYKRRKAYERYGFESK